MHQFQNIDYGGSCGIQGLWLVHKKDNEPIWYNRGSSGNAKI